MFINNHQSTTFISEDKSTFVSEEKSTGMYVLLNVHLIFKIFSKYITGLVTVIGKT
jgi:hypothetical protein